MNWFYNLKIGTKMISGFIIVALIAAIIGGIGIMNILEIDRLDTAMYETMTVPLGELAVIFDNYQRMRGNLKDIVLASTQSEFDDYENRIREKNQTFAETLDSFETTLFSEEGKRLVPEVRALKAEYDAVGAQVIAFAEANQDAQALALLNGRGSEIRTELEKRLYRLKELKVIGATETAAGNKATARSATIQMIVVLIIGVIISIGLGIFISRSITKPVAVLNAASQRIADGDLDVDINVTAKDEIGQLAAAFSRMVANVNDAMMDINSSAEQVSSGAVQVSDSSQQLSQGATEQASSVEEITASMEELSSQTTQNAANANRAREISDLAKVNAEKGNSQMKQMLNSMADINESSAKISKIIKVIDEIAFQTNILALNAAVEAARAGQHGKGFAVVAEEVRNLAARSANAAKETTEMIEGSIEKVGAGTTIANETAKALEEIVSGVAEAATLVAEIAAASNEQAAGIDQVNQAIMQVSMVVQTNSATSEEAAAASEELSSQADILKQAVNRFKLKRTQMSRSQFDHLDADLLKMLSSGGQSRPTNRPAGNDRKIKIDLSDQDFGKY